nr:hypothetical protein [Chthoniobacterales bacterium]
MPAEETSDLPLEIGHVLFVDIVGYSKLLISEQTELLQHLKEMVRSSEQVRAAEAEGKLIRLATGDGMALVFRSSPEAPAHCALELARVDLQHPELKLRMGIHSGPINQITDLNDRINVTGAGINMAQRVMDCGDAGHILLSQHVADDLEQYPRWRPLLHELGECEVKHGVRLRLVNLYSDGVGNPELPEKFKKAGAAAPEPQRRKSSLPLVGISLLIFLLIGLAITALIFAPALFKSRRPAPAPSSSAPPPASTPATPEKSIAVLPFENLSENKENAFFADGVQDEILTNLAKVAALKVISRTSVNGYRNTAGRNLRKIGQELGVAHLLEGSVQRAGNRVRINAQLIDARTDAHLWAQTYDRELSDVFAIQSEIAKAIADQLQAKLSPGEKAAIEQPLTTDLVANALYVQAGQLQFPPERERLLEAVRLLDQAVARDPHFLLAYCQLARSHRLLFWFGHDHTPGRLELAHAAIQNAARLDRDAGEVHLALAEYALQGRRDYDGARAELELAQRTLPNNADVYFWYGAIDRRQGRWSEAITDFAHAVLLDPRNVHILVEAAGTYTALRRYPEAERLLERAVAVLPDSSRVRISLAKQSIYGRADLGPLRSVLSSIASGGPTSAGRIAAELLNWAILARDAAAAQQAVTALPASGGGMDQGNFRAPSEWLVAVAARAFHDTAAAQNSFLAARAIGEKLVRDQPEYAPAWSLLGQIDAALGRKEDAIREGRRACELMPLSRDAFSGPGMITDLA